MPHNLLHFSRRGGVGHGNLRGGGRRLELCFKRLHSSRYAILIALLDGCLRSEAFGAGYRTKRFIAAA